MAVNKAAFLLLVRARLREANNSKLGETQSGTNTTPTADADTRLMELGQRVAEELCRTCIYLSATAINATLAANTQLTMPTMPSGIGQIWRPTAVAWNGSPLREMQRANLPLGWELTSAGTPTRWWREGEGQIGLYPKPATVASLQVIGAAFPSAPTGTDGWSYAPDEIVGHLMATGTAYLVSLLNTDDDALAARGQVWKGEYEKERMRLWGNLTDSLKRQVFPSPPMALGGKRN